jgi:two-component system cell cycle response regulator DivK
MLRLACDKEGPSGLNYARASGLGRILGAGNKTTADPRPETESEGKLMSAAKILYIEDDFQNRVLVRRVLEAAGFATIEAENGPRGLQLAKEERPDLILMDINLPEMDGYEVTSRLKQIDTLAHIPIVAMTANVMKGDREKTLAAGCDGYIQKPIDVDLLPSQITQYLTAKDPGRASRPQR